MLSCSYIKKQTAFNECNYSFNEDEYAFEFTNMLTLKEKMFDSVLFFERRDRDRRIRLVIHSSGGATKCQSRFLIAYLID